jgi:hypothetical protein
MKNRRTRLVVIIETGIILVAVVCFLRHSVSSSLKSALRAPVSVPHVLSAKAVANITVKTPCATPVAVSEPETPSFGWAEGVVALVSKALTPDERNEANRILTDLAEETPDDELFGSLVFRLAQNNPLSASKLASTLPAGKCDSSVHKLGSSNSAVWGKLPQTIQVSTRYAQLLEMNYPLVRPRGWLDKKVICDIRRDRFAG